MREVNGFNVARINGAGAMMRRCLHVCSRRNDCDGVAAESRFLSSSSSSSEAIKRGRKKESAHGVGIYRLKTGGRQCVSLSV